jgi:hypothetical protein
VSAPTIIYRVRCRPWWALGLMEVERERRLVGGPGTSRAQAMLLFRLMHGVDGIVAVRLED